MSLCQPNTLLLRYKPFWHSHSCPYISASVESRVTERKANTDCLDSKERIRKLFNKVELSVSAYDTAWVAMVPSPSASQKPCFPECVNWILDNQFSDGSWGVNHHHPLLIKDALTSTLACVLALKRWDVGEDKINKGLQFIKSKFISAVDESQQHPVGFDIIFPGMLDHAKDLDLNLSVEPTILAAIRRNRELELQKKFSKGREAYLAYASEGMGKLQDWNAIMKYQRKNGSIFNSPSTTAAALIYSQNDGCLNYLHSLLKKVGNAVPTVYPLDIYASLCMVDSLEKLGIDRHFRKEIRSLLDEIYHCWLQGEEEIFMDCATCAMAFRILRLNGYNITSDLLTQFTEEKLDSDSPRGHLKDIIAALELYKASQIVVYPDELAFEEQNLWSYSFLKQKLFNIKNKDIFKEVDDALKFPFYAKLERIENRRKIENYNVDSTKILKTSFCSPNISNRDFLKVAVEDFNICQSIHLEELKNLERWVVENRLDKLKFARQKSAYCYFSAAATFFSPELFDARMSWAKNGILTTIVDDFFDIGGSMEELKNLILLVEKSEANLGPNCCSEQVQIIFSALHSTICEIGGNAFAYQGCNLTSHVKEIWLNLLNSMLREAEWVRDKSVPTIDEYMTNGYVSFALGPIVLPAVYLVGPKLPRDDACNYELHHLFKLMSICGRLLNDIHSFKRESKEGKLNAVSLHMIHHCSSISEEELVGEIKNLIKGHRRELLRLVLEDKGSVVPRACKDLFWKMCKVFHMFYIKDDGFSSNEMINVVKAVIHEPISVDDL